MLRRILVGAVLIASFALPLSASASYTDPFGHTYTDAQVAQFCAAVRPGSASWLRYCD
jgi:hypothetical protein